MIIVSNAGHAPGIDPGATGVQIAEADLAKEYVELINHYLNAIGIETVFVQEDELEDVCDVINNSGASMFYSLHFNAFNETAKGTEVWYYEGEAEDKKLANCIQKQLVTTLGTVDRGIKETTKLYVLNNSNPVGVLIEVGFIDNPEEEDMLIKRKDDACRAIARGITDYISGESQANPVERAAANIDTDSPTMITKPEQVKAKYFDYDELSCHHCGQLNIDPILLKLLDEIREHVGGPVYLNSVYRCPYHNADIGGARNSQHVLGRAADIDVPEGWTVDQLADLAESLGADGVGRYYDDDFVHVDVREGRNFGDYRWDDTE